MLNLILRNNSIPEAIITAAALLFAAFGAIVFHEFAHGWVAYKCGDPTAKMQGRLTLNPAKHFDVVGLLMFLIAGFGWARPVPINPNNFRKRKKSIVLVSLSGVVTNFILAFISFGLYNLFYYIILQTTVEVNGAMFWFLNFILYLFFFGTIVNISLASFNILPLFPLDGFRFIEALWPNSKYCVFMRRYGSMILLGIVFVSYFLGRYIWFLDIFGMYIEWMQKSILSLMNLIFGIK